MSKTILAYKSGKTGKTGRALCRALEISSHKHPQRATKVINWGTSEYYGIESINSPCSIENASNKLLSLKILEENGVRVPAFTNDYNYAKELFNNLRQKTRQGYPTLVGRPTHHQGGSGFVPIFGQPIPLCDYYMRYVPIYKEYRVHVFRNKILGISKKVSDGVEHRITNKWCRNHTNGWKFVLLDQYQCNDKLKQMAIDAVSSLNLDFGAVDIILSDDEIRKYYVLEINTAPSLEPNSTIFNNYVEELKKYV